MYHIVTLIRQSSACSSHSMTNRCLSTERSTKAVSRLTETSKLICHLVKRYRISWVFAVQECL